MKKPKSLLREYAERDGPANNDFDPEDEEHSASEEESESGHDENSLDGTEHYSKVGKSQLRKPEEINLGPKYSGAKISRKNLLEDDSVDSSVESDDSSSDTFTNSDMAESDEDEDENESASDGEKNSKTNRKLIHKIPQSKSVSDESNSDEDEGSSGSESDEIVGAEGATKENEEKSQRSELLKIMGDDQNAVLSTITQAVKADVDKGMAVKLQRKLFDSLLNLRIMLQKALVATNSLAVVEKDSKTHISSEPYQAAEEAAIKLWNSLNGMRHELFQTSSTAQTGQKRKLTVSSSMPSSSIWEKMQETEVASINYRQETLEKWSSKVRLSMALPLSQKLNATASQQSITSLLQDQLANSEHLVRKTKIPRSCAPIQRDSKISEDPNIYDDANFYQILLKDLVDRRRADQLSGHDGFESVRNLPGASIKDVKTKKVVDTKASKGRKLRYTVHEKIQNFMAPEDRSSWEPSAVDRLFNTLLGQQATLQEDENVSEHEDAGPEEQRLKLFES
ncbi:traub transcription factor family protein [Blumeria hordei DH14]|uniref:Protein BFR2 n=1 Tax=Blumeria graminis f. sp. hordei (strain DH14) TaxID=546991 RepID=N1J8Q8_BLUG1|nr:traub transcription factor family protein [Blumeria hordei DH14]